MSVTYDRLLVALTLYSHLVVTNSTAAASKRRVFLSVVKVPGYGLIFLVSLLF